MEQPTHCIVRKIIWGVLLGLGIMMCLAGLSFINKLAEGDGSVLMVIVIMLGVASLITACGIIPWAFEPELDKMKKKRELYKKQQGRAYEEEYYSVDADIHHRSIKKRSRSLKQGISIEKCPNCGDSVDANENFCNKCGTEIYNKCPKCETVNQAGD